MSNVNVDSQIIKEAMNICNKAIDMLRATQKQMQNKYREAGENWNDSKYQQLGDIVDECDSSINKTLRELDGCLAPLKEIEQHLRVYEDINLIGLAVNSTTRSTNNNSGLYGYNSSSAYNLSNDIFYPAALAGVLRTAPMTRDEANHEKPNPHFNRRGGYHINCQTCVVAFEARIRGYNVSALPNTEGSRLQELSRQTNLAWIDPSTSRHPEYIPYRGASNSNSFIEFMENTVQQGERYTLQFIWNVRSENGEYEGHIISLDRDENGSLRLYDPQTGHTTVSRNISGYVDNFNFSNSYDGQLLPQLLRVDNVDFNVSIVNDVLEETR